MKIVEFTDTQKAKMAAAGISKQYISGLEHGLFKPSAAKADIIAKALRIGFRRALRINTPGQTGAVA